jgi:hypothetical protein
VETPWGKIPLGRRGHRWKDSIKMDLKEIDWDSVDRIVLASVTSVRLL